MIDAAKGAGAKDICLVVGYKHEVVEAEISHQDVQYALQTEQLGTGHAVKCAGDFLTGGGETLILFGDTPLITADTLKRLKDYHREKGNTVTVLSAMVDDPTGYGRIIRDENGNFIKSVEHKDANEAELASHEINSGMYIFDTKELRQALDLLTTDNAQGEYYLPDTLTIIKNKGLKADAFALENAEDLQESMISSSLQKRQKLLMRERRHILNRRNTQNVLNCRFRESYKTIRPYKT